jgi:quinol monooxygenase YgiN
MIIVIASIRVKSGKMADYLAMLKTVAPEVRNEKGCIEYIPTVDLDSKMPPQVLEREVVTILEKWASLGDLQAHLLSAHMLDYREKVKNLIEKVTIKVLQEA